MYGWEQARVAASLVLGPLRSMPVTLASLIHRDHQDLDRSLTTMTAGPTSASEAVALLEAVRIGMTAHAIGQTMVFRDLLDLSCPQALAAVVRTILDEHREQARALAELANTRPGTSAWNTRASELRVMLLDHSAREEFVRVPLWDHVPADVQRSLASTYATERLRRMAVADAPRRSPLAPVWSFN